MYLLFAVDALPHRLMAPWTNALLISLSLWARGNSRLAIVGIRFNKELADMALVVMICVYLLSLPRAACDHSMAWSMLKCTSIGHWKLSLAYYQRAVTRSLLSLRHHILLRSAAAFVSWRKVQWKRGKRLRFHTVVLLLCTAAVAGLREPWVTNEKWHISYAQYQNSWLHVLCSPLRINGTSMGWNDVGLTLDNPKCELDIQQEIYSSYIDVMESNIA